MSRAMLREVKAGNHVAVVVSAMAGTTDQLVAWCRQAAPVHDAREYDAVVVRRTGHCWASGNRTAGHRRPRPLLARLADSVETDGVHGSARMAKIDATKSESAWSRARSQWSPGSRALAPTSASTLGRGGSDTSAVAIAASLEAACDIYTDVDGVYTADPRIVTAAHKLDRISYEEMLEQASLGAKVLQTRSVELAMVYKVPLQVRSSFEAPDSPNQNKPDGTGPEQSYAKRTRSWNNT